MDKRFSMLVGTTLILIGILALVFTLVMPILGIAVWRWGAWRLWPLLVIGVGLLFVVSPLLVRDRRGLGALFIPGVLILTTGGILLFTSVFDVWGAWEWLWPLEVLAVALGFLFAAIKMRAIWLLVPAIIIGANGLLFQFCALTGWWQVWAALWAIEPLSLGLAFLLISIKNRSSALFVAGLVLCALAATGLIGMTAILSLSAFWPGLWLINLVGPVVLILVGALLIIWNVVRQPSSPLVENGA